MEKYCRIVLAIELNESSDELPLRKAIHLSKEFNASLTLVHAVESAIAYGAVYGLAAGVDIENILLENAHTAMDQLVEKMGISYCNKTIKVGSAKEIILEEANQSKADLIIVGSHGRQGVRLLLGSTANAILHAALCDVLAVRILNSV